MAGKQEGNTVGDLVRAMQEGEFPPRFTLSQLGPDDSVLVVIGGMVHTTTLESASKDKRFKGGQILPYIRFYEIDGVLYSDHIRDGSRKIS